MPSVSVSVGVLAPTLLLLACSGPLDAPSAYGDQVFVCSDDAEREARTAECRQTSACSGWVSFRGMLQDQPVTVGSPIELVALDFVNAPGVGAVRDEIELRSLSPYFRLRWLFSELPALKEIPEETEYAISLREEAGTVKSSLRLNGGGASVDLPARTGTFRTRWDAEEQVGDAHLEFGSSSFIDGCFFARTSLESAR